MSAAKNPRQVKMALARDAALQALEPPAALPARWWGAGRAGAQPAASPRQFARVPTHVVAVAQERRGYPRAVLSLPLRLTRVAGRREPGEAALTTVNISSSGVYFLSPQAIEPGTPVEIEVRLVEKRRGRGSVRMSTLAHVVRIDPVDKPGLYGLAVAFDDITFHRDEAIPLRYQEL